MEIKNKKELNVGDILATPIYDTNGTTLLPAGTKLTENYINRLNEFYSREAYINVQTPGSEIIVVQDNIGEELRNSTAKAIRNREIGSLIEFSKTISKKVVDYDIHEVDYYDKRKDEDYISRHSVNVAVISCIIGKSMGFNEKELQEVTLAGLLHDFAKTSNVNQKNIEIYAESLNKPKEAVLPLVTVDYLRDTDYVKEGIISPDLLGSLMFHNEHHNGTGYYKKGADFLKKYKYASILHVANVYDTLSNNDIKTIVGILPEKSIDSFSAAGGITPKTIIDFFRTDCSSEEDKMLFNPEVVRKFLECVSVYSVGRRITLSNGDVAIVISNNPEVPEKPVVKVIEGIFKDNIIDLNKEIEHLDLIVQDYYYDNQDKNILKK